MRRMVCFGDSITAGHGFTESPLTKQLQEELGDLVIINSGVSGDTTEDGIERFEREVLAHNPSMVTILFGSNDGADHRKVSLTLFRNNLLHMVNHLKASSVLLITPPAVDEKVQQKRTNGKLRSYSNVVQEVAEETGVEVFDLFGEMLQMKDYTYLVDGPDHDGLHFSLEGYALLSSKIQEFADRHSFINKGDVFR
ncbi:esterase [Pontibacillus chungwhensis BH030062]|uniref:Esterase n=1 Tax=Pontibacillus chungwhensis BH030062 TaxID=1385513 RepID=A0A0A2V342_9BACI|nr:GDSL-type esterase/lipase family protein [Pontibacillus chungwhensis]KGP93236.1 esterase [Pontibacillus chungwhensis BH030062]